MCTCISPSCFFVLQRESMQCVYNVSVWSAVGVYTGAYNSWESKWLAVEHQVLHLLDV